MLFLASIVRDIGENESAKYWLSVLNELKNRGVKDIMIVCADGLSGIKEAIATAFPNTEYQRCLVHQVRNTLKYVPDKDRKAFAKDLKTIYNASTEEEGRKALDKVTEKWEEKYPRAMKRWYDNWDALPKGTDLKALGLTDQSALNLVISHVDSAPVEKLGGKSPLVAKTTKVL